MPTRTSPIRSDLVVAWVDAAAILVFAFEGGVLAAGSGLDLFGVMVVAIVSSVGGGTIRDLLIGASPPASIQTPYYALVGLAGGLAGFAAVRWSVNISADTLTVIDAAGLALFTVSGSVKSLDYRIRPIMCVFMGAVTGVGGGVIRDILLNRVPAVLGSDVYATAALAGAAVLVIGLRRGAPRSVMMVAGGTVCFLVRMLAFRLHWNLPTAVP